MRKQVVSSWYKNIFCFTFIRTQIVYDIKQMIASRRRSAQVFSSILIPQMSLPVFSVCSLVDLLLSVVERPVTGIASDWD
jgi:hypothetical protein